MARHIVWRRRKHDGRYYPAIEFNYQGPANAEAKARAQATGEQAFRVDETRHAHIEALADLRVLYPVTQAGKS